MLSFKSHLDGGEFDHLVAYSVACTIENDEYELKHGVIRFGSFDKLIKVDDLVCLDDHKEVPKKAARMDEQRRHDRASHQEKNMSH